MGALNVAIEGLDTQPVVVLNDSARGRRVRIARHGACVLAIEATVRGRRVELTDGHRNAAELVARPGSRFAVLAPFANRVDDARYRFEGIEHDLTPGATGAARASRHGFVRDAGFVNVRWDSLTLGVAAIHAGDKPHQPAA